MPVPESDAGAIRRSLDDPRAFTVIFTRHFARIHSYLARRVGSQLADDLSAEVFRQAFEGRQRYHLDRACARPQRWELAGRPDLSIPFNTDRSYGRGEMADWKFYSSLSTDVGDLRKEMLRRFGNDRGDRVSLFVAIGDLLRETAASPALRSALYRLAAEIPGVELLGATTDGRGRPGVAVAMTSDYSGVRERDTMIFNPDDGILLEEQRHILERARWTPTPPPFLSSVATYVESETVESIPAPQPPDPAQVAALVERCIGNNPPGDPADDYLGLNPSELRRKYRAEGLTYRLLGRDGVCQPLTDDRQPNRLNVLVLFDRVVWARRF